MTTLMADAESNALADFEASRITHLSIHTDTPGKTGANEAVGGSPPYIRLPVIFTTAGVEGVLGSVKQPATVGVAWSDELVFDAPAGTYPYWGSWDSEVDGLYRIGNAISSPDTYDSQTLITLSVGVGQVSGA
jgi:hypothetical protein